MTLVVRWSESSPYGPSLEFLCCVEDMGAARTLAEAAEAMDGPSKRDKLRRTDPLVAVAEEHPGELLWRIEPTYEAAHAPGYVEHEWAIGVDSARELRLSDVDRYTSIYEAAQARRRERRRSGGR